MHALFSSRLLPIVQEMLVNALRHAQAKQITLLLEHENNQGIISVEDDGCGFVPDRLHTDNVTHFGLKIMRARAVQLKGKITIESEEGRGTRVGLVWPLANGGRHLTPVSEVPDSRVLMPNASVFPQHIDTAQTTEVSE